MIVPDEDGEEHEISGLGQSGDGIVDTPHGRVFVPGGLPGETVVIRNGVAHELGSTLSHHRRETPLCPHSERCGGCAMQHVVDPLYRIWKAGLLVDALRFQGIDINPEPMLSVSLNSRRRAVLTARRGDSDAVLGFHVRRSHDIEAISDCAVLTARIVAALPGLRALATLLLARSTDAHVTVIDTPHGLDVAFDAGRRNLSPDERGRLTALAASAKLARVSVTSEMLVLLAEPVLEISGVAVVPPPGAFLQAVREAETAMSNLVMTAIPKAKRVADLFSGLGTFTFAMARQAQVLAVDSERSLIEALDRAQRRAQGLKPIQTKVRDLFADPLSPRELDAFDAVVFDPPRAGAKAQAEALARSKVRTVIAVSCNPQSLARDLRILADGGYRLERVISIDQFLFTPHLEAIALLQRRKH